MLENPSFCDRTSGLMPLEVAVEAIKAQISTIEKTEEIPTGDALGRILANPLFSPINFPLFDNSAMDGYALFAEKALEGDVFKVVGVAYAGKPYLGEIGPGECVRIFTGAQIPNGSRVVVIQENTGPLADAEGFIRLLRGVSRAENIRFEGEELVKGDLLLCKGTFLGAGQLGLIASSGLGHVRVYAKPKVAFASTGDELCDEGHPLARGQIYDSNRLTLKALLIEAGMEPIDLGAIPDDPSKIRACLIEAAEVADVILTSGGASVGDADFVSSMLSDAGQLHFWKVAMKPGKPFLFGRLGKAHFMGLPGNPVSMVLTFLQLVRPGLMKLSGRMAFEPLKLRALLQGKIPGSAERKIFLRGIAYHRDGELRVEPLSLQGSHQMTSITKANVLIVVPPHMAPQAAGSWVQVELLPHAQIGSSPT